MCFHRRPSEEGEGEKNYYVVTNKWTQFTNFKLTPDSLLSLANYCDEFLVHGVDVEGKRCGIEEDLVTLLGKYSPIPVCYAGGREKHRGSRAREAVGEWEGGLYGGECIGYLWWRCVV